MCMRLPCFCGSISSLDASDNGFGADGSSVDVAEQNTFPGRPQDQFDDEHLFRLTRI